MERKNAWCKGMVDGIPIALGYFAVSFTFGIQAGKAGLSAVEALILSITNLTSAGQFAGLSVMLTNASYLDMLMTQVVINLRYLLMSCALSQKIDDQGHPIHRLAVAYGITDEIFGVSICKEGKINPYYIYGLICIAGPGWGIGTFLGTACKDILIKSLNSALGIAIYGMFIAVIIPAAKKERKVFYVVLLAMLLSVMMKYIPLFLHIPSWLSIIMITVIVAGMAAFVFPRKEDKQDAA